MVIAPNWVERLGTRLRWIIAIALLGLGILGMRSSFTQHRDADTVQKDLIGKVDSLQGKSDKLQATVDSYGPKLDEIIAHPESPEQLVLATDLRNRLKPRIQIDEPFPDTTMPTITMLAEVTNVGGSIAKGVSSTSLARIAVENRDSETKLFDELYNHEDAPDVKPMDMNPGYEGRSRVTIASYPPITPELFRQMRANEVVYVGILTVFFDEHGRKYHTEKCMYFSNRKEELNKFCDGHNLTN